MLRATDPASLQKAAREAGLRYAADDKPGITRLRHGKSFTYKDAKGKTVRDPKMLGRIKRLAIPPAWARVWICPSPDGHLQATGYDDRKRKQYRYHSDWRQVRDENKFGRVMAFGRKLPALRRRVNRDLKARGLPREKVLATVVKLLEMTLIRVGNDEYARDNRSYGLTTMRDHHAKVRGGSITFHFRGKSGKQHEISVRDPELARIVKRCQDLPDQEIFGYLDENGEPRDVKSQDVNDYLREIMGDAFTAKDFRTWYGTVLAAVALREFAGFATKKEAKANVVRAIENVSKMLGNTPSICRKCYVHPQVLEAYLEGNTISTLEKRGKEIPRGSLSKIEKEVIAFLQRRLAASRRKAPTKAADLAGALRKSISRQAAKKRRVT